MVVQDMPEKSTGITGRKVVKAQVSRGSLGGHLCSLVLGAACISTLVMRCYLCGRNVPQHKVLSQEIKSY